MGEGKPSIFFVTLELHPFVELVDVYHPVVSHKLIAIAYCIYVILYVDM